MKKASRDTVNLRKSGPESLLIPMLHVSEKCPQFQWSKPSQSAMTLCIAQTQLLHTFLLEKKSLSLHPPWWVPHLHNLVDFESLICPSLLESGWELETFHYLDFFIHVEQIEVLNNHLGERRCHPPCPTGCCNGKTIGLWGYNAPQQQQHCTHRRKGESTRTSRIYWGQTLMDYSCWAGATASSKLCFLKQTSILGWWGPGGCARADIWFHWRARGNDRSRYVGSVAHHPRRDEWVELRKRKVTGWVLGSKVEVADVVHGHPPDILYLREPV